MSNRAELREACHALALLIGVRPAARKLGVNEDTACVWSHRHNWNIPSAFKLNGGPIAKRRKDVGEAVGSIVRKTLEDTFKEQSDDARLYLSSAGLKASYDLAQQDGSVIRGKNESVGMLNVTRSLDVVHGWTAERATPTTQVALQVVMPTAEEKAERRALDAKLDAIAARLRDATPGEGVARPRVSEG